MLNLLAGAIGKKEKRVALVIGNAHYSDIGELRCSRQDALRMGKALNSLGFKVYFHSDLKRNELVDAIADFSPLAHDADIVFVYFSGHGTQLAGENYLLPVDAGRQVSLNGMQQLRLDAILAQIDNQVGKTIVVLDACRDLPSLHLVSQPAAAIPVQAVAPVAPPPQVQVVAKSGMADAREMAVQAGQTIVAFATAPGRVAYEGNPGHRVSPFTAALLRHIRRPGVDFVDLLQDVVREVPLATHFCQQPWINLSVNEPIFLRGRMAWPVVMGAVVGLTSAAFGWYLADIFIDLELAKQSVALAAIYALATFLLIWRWSRSGQSTTLAVVTALFAWFSAATVADLVYKATDPTEIRQRLENDRSAAKSQFDKCLGWDVACPKVDQFRSTLDNAEKALVELPQNPSNALASMLPAPLAAVTGGLLTMLGLALAVPGTRRVRYFLSAVSTPAIIAFVYATLAEHFGWHPSEPYFRMGIWTASLVTVCGYVVGNARHEMVIDEQPIFPSARPGPILWAAAGGAVSAIFCTIYVARSELIGDLGYYPMLLGQHLTKLLLVQSVFEVELNRIVPGVIFGIFLSILTFRFTRKREASTLVLPTVGTVLAWYSAVWVGERLTSAEGFGALYYEAIAIAGVTGGSITLLACALVNNRIWRIIFWILTLFASAICGLTYPGYKDLTDWLFVSAGGLLADGISLFFMWQIAVAACIAYALTARATVAPSNA